MPATAVLPRQLGLPRTNTLGPGDTVKPFLRWVGSKRKLVGEIRALLPRDFQRYHEPFVGSGALFFALQPRVAYLSDLNTRLCRTYTAMQSDLDAVLEALRVYVPMYEKHGAEFYNHVRTFDPDLMTDVECAAWFIFTNKTGFNGIYRVNRDGKYNVPPGKFASPPVVCDEVALRRCADALKSAIVINTDFRSVEERAQPGDLCYFDSPYAPMSPTSDFTSYTRGGFDDTQQVALRDLAARLKKRGVHVVLSNSSAPIVRKLYEGWDIHEISRQGTVSSKADDRGRVTELLIR